MVTNYVFFIVCLRQELSTIYRQLSEMIPEPVMHCHDLVFLSMETPTLH